ncbi:MAG: PAS domain S-box protein [Dissulfurispiraceae bacterium]
MAKKNKSGIPDSKMPADNPDLRRRAEEMLLKQPGAVDKIPPADVQRVVHELQVHQIELEMQNEELRRVQQELETAREKYFDLYDLAPAGYVSLNEEGIILEANLTATILLGVERNNLVGHPLFRFVCIEDQDLYYLCRKRLVETSVNQACVLRIAKKDGTPFWVRIDISTAQGIDNTKGSRAIIIDISERKRIEEKLKKSEKRYHSLFENMSEGSAYCKMLYDNNGRPTDFVYLDVNTAFGKLTGLHNVVGKNVTEVIPGIKESHPELFEIYSRVALTGQPEKFQIEFKPLSAWLSVSVYSTEKNYFVAVFDNITERKQAERRQALSAEILLILNDPPALGDATNRVLAAIKRETGFDAVGIRLHRGDDFPYFAQDGFSKEFLIAENSLAVRTQDGGVCVDKNGNVSLECTCGLVISGRTDSTKSLFTPRGSCWTNESFQLLELSASQDPRLHPRNRCIHEGFHSVALIPLRAGKQIIGILQLNDRRPKRFTPELISFFEDLGAVIGIAFARKQAEDELLQTSDQLQLTLQAAEFGVWDYDFKTGTVFWDERCRNMWGIPTGNPRDYKEAIALIHPEDRQATAEAVNRAIAGSDGGSYRREFRVVWPDGSVHWMSSHGRVYFEGEGNNRRAMRFLGVNMEITERKRAEELSSLLSAVVESSDDAIVSKDLNGVIRSWNIGAEKLFGYTAEEAVGRQISFLLPPGHIDEVPDIIKRIVRGDHIDQFETLRMRKDGTVIPVSLTFSPIKDARDKIVGVSKVAHNIAERKQAEEQIRILNEQLKHQVAEQVSANRELEAFSYSVSHDLRAPLRHMTGFAKMLQKKLVDDPDEKTHQYLDLIIEASKKMGMLIEDLLSFSYIGRAELQMRKVSLNALVGGVVKEIQEELKERQISWEIDELPDVLGDQSLLRLMIVNLVSNAVKFTSTRPNAEIKIGCKDEGDKFTCAVADNGAGFDMEYADRLFGVFQRLHTQEEFKGTGIGLANVQRIISRHGGSVWAEGAVGQGATFYFTLPKIKDA